MEKTSSTFDCAHFFCIDTAAMQVVICCLILLLSFIVVIAGLFSPVACGSLLANLPSEGQCSATNQFVVSNGASEYLRANASGVYGCSSAVNFCDAVRSNNL